MWITRFSLCSWILFCLPQYIAVLNHPPLFGSNVRTMLQLCCAHLISLNCCQAQTDRDNASNHKEYFLTQYLKILNLEEHQNGIIGLKNTAILLNLTEWFFHVHYITTYFHYLINQNYHKLLFKNFLIKRSNL